MSGSVDITAVVAAYDRIDRTLATLERLRACRPTPAEILVHVDGNQTECVRAIRTRFADVGLITSRERVGPGGSRNKLVGAAQNEFVASFDDDSFPMDDDYFARAAIVLGRFPAAAVLSAEVHHPGEGHEGHSRGTEWVADFSGGACVYRRSAFLATSGYVPLVVAYGMEEVDLALRLHSKGGRILRTPWLRVFHDADLSRHAVPRVTAGSIANLALLTYLRYPPSLWIVGFAQCCARVLWLLRNGRSRGIVSGLLMIPRHLSRNRAYRGRVSACAIRSYLTLRRGPLPVGFEPAQ